MKRLKNATVAACVEETAKQSEALQELLYGQYKNAYKLSLSNHFRGPSATACKNYITNITINNLNGMINVMTELGDTLKAVESLFLEYETAEEGIVDTEVLGEVLEEVDDVYKTAYAGFMTEVNSVLGDAASYITITPLSETAAEGAYTSLENKLEEINDNLLECDKTAKQKLETLLGHMACFENMIDGISRNVDAEGHIDYENVERILGAETFYVEDAGNVARMIEEDPFSYYADGGSGWEQQWAAGALQDVYAYGGLSAWTGEYVVSTEDGKNSAEAGGAFFSGDAALQMTDYMAMTAGANLVHGNGAAFAGWSREHGYYGLGVEGEAAVFDADAEVKLGTEEFNAYADAGVSLFSASGYAKAEYSGENEFAVGIGGNLTGASAEASAGLSFFEVAGKDSDEGKKQSLFNLSAGVEASVGVGAGVMVESTKVIDNDVIDVNTLSLQIEGKVFLGVDLYVTVPYITIN